MLIGNTYNDGTVKWRVTNQLPSMLVGGGNPIGTIVPYAINNDLPEGYLICNGAEILIEEYPDLYNKIGNTYGTPSDNNHFVLPDLRDKFIEGSIAAGTVKTAGLPNITGDITLRPMSVPNSTNYTTLFEAYHNSIKASQSTVENTIYSLKYDTLSSTRTKIEIDASKSNSIYGNSSTVQPPALTLIYIIKALKIENEGINFLSPYNKRDIIISSGTYTVPYDGWYKITAKGGGGGGGGSSSYYYGGRGGGGGGAGGEYKFYKYLIQNQQISITIGAGGTGGTGQAQGTSGTGGGATIVIINNDVYKAGGGGAGGSFYNANVGGNGGSITLNDQTIPNDNIFRGKSGVHGFSFSGNLANSYDYGRGGLGGDGIYSSENLNNGSGGVGGNLYINYTNSTYTYYNGYNGSSGYVYIEYFDPTL